MQPRKKEIEEAWKIHDRRPDEFKCQDEPDWQKKRGYCDSCKKTVNIKWKVGTPYCTNSKCKKRMKTENMNHSHFNPVCQRMVKKYAKEHPIPRQHISIPEVPMARCSVCRKRRPISKLEEIKTTEKTELICQKCWDKKKKRDKLRMAQAKEELAAMAKLEKEAPKNCPRGDVFGYFTIEDSTCRTRCNDDQRILCQQKTKEREAEEKKLPSSQTQLPKS